MKIDVARQFFEKVPSMKFHENLHSVPRICYKRPDSERTSRKPQQLHVEEIGCEGAGWIEVSRLDDFMAI
jgi:hypothetical protein